MTVHAQTKLLETLDHFPSPIEFYKEWPNVPVPVPAGKTDAQALEDAWVDALNKTKVLIGPAEYAALEGMNNDTFVGGINLDSINPQARRDMAKLIVTSFLRLLDMANFTRQPPWRTRSPNQILTPSLIRLRPRTASVYSS
jgi:hypothetical protein